jgi:predicted nuclease of predicted toxin-antitoxin system
MRLLLDMNMPRGIAALLRQSGHDAVHLGERGQGRLLNDDVFALASAEERILVTFDLDFGKIAGLAAKSGNAIILLRLRAVRSQHVHARLTTALAATGAALASGAFVVVEDTRIRVRSLPPS